MSEVHTCLPHLHYLAGFCEKKKLKKKTKNTHKTNKKPPKTKTPNKQKNAQKTPTKTNIQQRNLPSGCIISQTQM